MRIELNSVRDKKGICMGEQGCMKWFLRFLDRIEKSGNESGPSGGPSTRGGAADAVRFIGYTRET